MRGWRAPSCAALDHGLSMTLPDSSSLGAVERDPDSHESGFDTSERTLDISPAVDGCFVGVCVS